MKPSPVSRYRPTRRRGTSSRSTTRDDFEAGGALGLELEPAPIIAVPMEPSSSSDTNPHPEVPQMISQDQMTTFGIMAAFGATAAMEREDSQDWLDNDDDHHYRDDMM